MVLSSHEQLDVRPLELKTRCSRVPRSHGPQGRRVLVPQVPGFSGIEEPWFSWSLDHENIRPHGYKNPGPAVLDLLMPREDGPNPDGGTP